MRLKQGAVKQALHQRAVQFASQHAPGKNLRIAYGYARGKAARQRAGQRPGQIIVCNG